MHDYYFAERGIAYRTNEYHPERPTLVFIHGLSGSLSAWYPYETFFEGRYNLVMLDLRGHGRSKRWGRYEDYRIEEFAHDTLALMRYLKITRATVVAHSFGTLVALKVTEYAPWLFTRAILLGVNYKVHSLVRIRLTLPLLDLCSFLLRFLPLTRIHGARINYTDYRRGGDYDPRRIYADITNTGLHSYLWSLAYLYHFTSDELWAGMTAPTLILHGVKDRMVPIASARMLEKVMPHATLAVYDDLNHTNYIFFNDKITEVAVAVQNFLKA